jgi:hypothetical protein
MPRSPRHIHAGDVNLRGKKHKTMSCGCCECIDYREQERVRELEKEIKDYDIAIDNQY